MIGTPLNLPCGVRLKNRLAKSAMSENMGSSFKADEKFVRLYRRWAQGGTGLVITGNVMIDRRALGEANNVVIEEAKATPELEAWARAGTEMSTDLWMQLNHPGKQSPKFLSKEPVAPSAIPLKAPLDKMFNTPRELNELEIQDIIRRFGVAAKAAQLSGFTGVQIHGAHGYLVSQFLSPTHNQRHDQWGGPIENRMRFALEVYREIRRQVGPRFPVGIKINSADFQKGGFSEEESLQVVRTLAAEGMDLIEISGGSYETPVMTGVKQKASTRAREAYFLEFCEKVRTQTHVPLMLTGGFRTAEGMNAALATGACDVIGLARSLAINPEFSKALLEGKDAVSEVQPLTTGVKALDKIVPIEITWYTDQLQRIGQGKDPDPRMSVLGSIFRTIGHIGLKGLKRVRG